jgi:hypothetical protein
MANLIKKWEDIKYTPKAASTVFDAGWFISYDGSGGVVPATPLAFYGTATVILGAILEDIASGDTDFAGTRMIAYQKAENNEFLVDVLNGTLTAADIGSHFDVDGTNPGALDASGAGTQLEVTAVLDGGTRALVEISLSEPQA